MVVTIRGLTMRVTQVLVSLVLTLTMATAIGAAPRDPDTHFFGTTFGDMPEELVTAKEQGKDGILIFFEQEECPFCHRMRTTVLNQPEVQDYFTDHFLIFMLDIESTVPVTDFRGNPTTQKEFFETITRHRGATPVLAFFDLEGNLVVRYTGATTGVDEFMWLGQYVVDDAYKEIPFTRYKRQKRREQRGG